MEVKMEVRERWIRGIGRGWGKEEIGGGKGRWWRGCGDAGMRGYSPSQLVLVADHR
jgi:hypothetical protein